MEGFGSTIGIILYIITVFGVIFQGGRLSGSFRITANTIDFPQSRLHYPANNLNYENQS